MVAWAALSLASIPPLDDPTPAERATGALIIPPAVALVFFAFAGGRYLVMAVRARSAILLAVASACILLAEAIVARGLLAQLAADMVGVAPAHAGGVGGDR